MIGSEENGARKAQSIPPPGQVSLEAPGQVEARAPKVSETHGFHREQCAPLSSLGGIISEK